MNTDVLKNDFCNYLSCFFFSFFLRQSLCHPDWSAVAQSRLTETSTSWVQASAARVAGITGVCHHAWLSFVFLVETGFHRVDQAGLKLTTSNDPPALTPKVLGLQA